MTELDFSFIFILQSYHVLGKPVCENFIFFDQLDLKRKNTSIHFGKKCSLYDSTFPKIFIQDNKEILLFPKLHLAKDQRILAAEYTTKGCCFFKQKS